MSAPRLHTRAGSLAPTPTDKLSRPLSMHYNGERANGASRCMNDRACARTVTHRASTLA
jgi:hypothetical protein